MLNGKVNPYPIGSPWATLKKVLKKAPLAERRKAAAKLSPAYHALLDLRSEFLMSEDQHINRCRIVGMEKHFE